MSSANVKNCEFLKKENPTRNCNSNHVCRPWEVFYSRFLTIKHEQTVPLKLQSNILNHKIK